MKVQSATFYGQTLMTEVDGVFLQEGQAIVLDKIFLNNLITQTTYQG
jgi:hypothetical protein